MRVLVTGSRNWVNPLAINAALVNVQRAVDLEAGETITLVHGACPTGADKLAAQAALSIGWDVEAHPADWNAHGKAAGPIRNQRMVDLGADVCLAFPMPGSRGTLHCMRAAEKAGIPVITDWSAYETEEASWTS